MGWAAGGERAQRAARRLRGAGRGFHNGTLVSYSSNERSVDMRSSSSSGIGQDMVESLRASYQNPCLAARRRVPACAASAGHRRTCDHVKTSVGVAAVPYAARFGPLTAPQVAIGLRRARQARVRVDLLLCILRRCLRSNNELAGVRWPRDFEGGPSFNPTRRCDRCPGSKGPIGSLPGFGRGAAVSPVIREHRRESRPKQHEGLPKST